MVQMPMKDEDVFEEAEYASQKWVKAGVALLCQLDD